MRYNLETAFYEQAFQTLKAGLTSDAFVQRVCLLQEHDEILFSLPCKN